jgi:type IX secretion system PorP/SprF family membrane protein
MPLKVRHNRVFCRPLTRRGLPDARCAPSGGVRCAPGRAVMLLLLAMGCAPFTGPSLQAQDLAFTQFPSLPLHLNPALAGNSSQGHLTAIFRDQWPDFPQTYVSYALAWDQFFPELSSGFGLMVLGDRQGSGAFNTHSVHGYYVFGVPISQNAAIRVGMELSWSQRNLRWESLRFFDQLNPVFGFNDPSGMPNPTGEVAPGRNNVHWFDAGAGAMIFNRKTYAGFSVRHLPRPNTAFFDNREDRIPVAWSAQAGANLPMGRDRRNPAVFAPYALWISQGPFQQIRPGLRLGKGPVFGGMAYRLALMPDNVRTDALPIELGMRVSDWQFVYSYDISLGELAGNSGGAHEVSLRWGITRPEGRERSRQQGERLSCPVF